MIQIRKIREFTRRGSNDIEKYDAPFEPDLTFSNFNELFENAKEILESVPVEERYNIYVTAGHVPEGLPETRKKRQWLRQDIIPFDIDNIQVDTDDTGAPSLNPKYIDAICEGASIDRTKCVFLFSGNGLQVFVKPKFIIDDIKWFEKNNKYYQVLCSKINDTLSEYGLKGEADPSAFAPNRLLRCPHTLNKKPGKPHRIAVPITSNLEEMDWDLVKASGVPVIAEEDSVSDKEMGYFKIDTEAVLDGCNFLKHIKENAASATEPEWYAADSILARLKDGHKIIHEWSSNHPRYNARTVDKKIEQSLTASGPRTCENIDKYYTKCRECPNYKKVKSPISLRGENFIATEGSGFHMLGKRGALVPQYEDLRRFYHKQESYINCNGVHYRWSHGFYKELQDVWIDNYAQEHFAPVADNKKRNEFRGLVKATNIMDNEFFTKTTGRKINVSNGVLDIDTMELVPNDPKYGFKSQLPFEYDPKATAPTFEKMLDGITCGDKTLRANLLEFMGYAISNDKCKADKIMILTGEGQNGKSRFLNIFRALGGDGVKGLGVRDLQNPFHRQALDGALFNIMEEMPAFSDQSVWEELKALATGSIVTASKKFKDAYHFENRTKLIMTCNSLPRGTDPTHGYFRRLLLIPFNARFSHELGNIDVSIDDRIIDNELPGVLNMTLKAYKELVERDYQFTRSEAVERTLSSYMSDADNVTRWANEHLAVGKPSQNTKEAPEWMVETDSGEMVCMVKDMHKEYALWAEGEGEKAVSNVSFSKRLRAWARSQLNRENVEFLQKKVKKKNCRVISGVTWFGDAEL